MEGVTENESDDLGQIRRVDIGLIDRQRQMRKTFDAESIAQLAESMRPGLAQPICVRPQDDGRYRLVYGERRLLAAQQLGWHRIPAIVVNLNDEQARLRMWQENTGRKDVNPIDKARYLADALEEMGGKRQVASLARSLDMRDSTIRGYLLLLEAPPELQERIERGLGKAYGEAIGRLDKALHPLAMHYFDENNPPDLEAFRTHCAKLKERGGVLVQADDMFPGTDIPHAPRVPESAKFADSLRPEVAAVLQPKAPLPRMNRVRSTRVTIERYIRDLATSEEPVERDAAWVVYSVYSEMLRVGIIKPPAAES